MKGIRLVKKSTLSEEIESGLEVHAYQLPESTERQLRRLISDALDRARKARSKIAHCRYERDAANGEVFVGVPIPNEEFHVNLFISSCAHHAHTQSEYRKAAKPRNPLGTRGDFRTGTTETIRFPKNPSKSLTKLRTAIADIRKSLDDLQGLDFAALGTGQLGFPTRSYGDIAGTLSRLDRWAEEWQPLVKRGRGRHPGTSGAASMLAKAIRGVWKLTFMRTPLAQDAQLCNEAISIVLTGVGLKSDRRSIANLGRAPKSNSAKKR